MEPRTFYTFLALAAGAALAVRLADGGDVTSDGGSGADRFRTGSGGEESEPPGGGDGSEGGEVAPQSCPEDGCDYVTPEGANPKMALMGHSKAHK